MRGLLSPRSGRYNSAGTGRFLLLGFFLFQLACLLEMFMPGYLFCLVHRDCTTFHLFSSILLFFAFDVSLEIDFGHVIRLVAAIIILIFIARIVLFITIITQHRIFDVGTNHIATTL